METATTIQVSTAIVLTVAILGGVWTIAKQLSAIRETQARFDARLESLASREHVAAAMDNALRRHVHECPHREITGVMSMRDGGI